jgi:hypothetical protein
MLDFVFSLLTDKGADMVTLKSKDIIPKNILKEGMRLLTTTSSAGTVEYTGGAINKTSSITKKHKAVKPETQPNNHVVEG